MQDIEKPNKVLKQPGTSWVVAMENAEARERSVLRRPFSVHMVVAPRRRLRRLRDSSASAENGRSNWLILKWRKGYLGNPKRASGSPKNLPEGEVKFGLAASEIEGSLIIGYGSCFSSVKSA